MIRSLKRTVPAEAKLRSPVSIKNRVATVDFSKEFKTKHPGGKDAEKMTIYSIVNSLTELEEIEKVKFLIDGKEQQEYLGNFKFDALFPRSTQLISKDKAETTIETEDNDLVLEENDINSSKETSGQNSDTIAGLEILE